ncbi:MAG: hypothetical protein ACKVY0_26715 [Prosthecobacter sp.]|uniref:hypothetical protein n=1 Tax=Prosthecobacter sp. TaxID=1965333 RepID=UPI003902DA62
MPFDPNLPIANSPNSSAQKRAQLQSIVALIDAIPVGPPGQNGSDGTSVSGAIIDGTNTLDAGNPAEAA